MARPRFSEALVQRRRELGLTTAQASRVLKLKEQVLIALEEGDFESIPKSGYAQGMVSSYARYLGLDAREMVDLFLEDLAEYEEEMGIAVEDDARSRSSQHIRLTPQRSAVDESRRNLLPTAGGRAGDMGDFATTSSAQTRTGSVQLVNSNRMRSGGTAASQGRYNRYGNYDAADDGYDDIDTGVTVRSRRQRSLTSREQPRSTQSYRGARNTLTGDRITRSEPLDTYQDDLAPRSATSFEPASSAEGRRKSHRIAQTERPGTASRRKKSTGARTSSRSRTSRASSGGIEDILSFISESRAIIGIVALVLILVLVVVIFMGIQSCTRGQNQTEPQTVPVSSVSTTTGSIDEESQAEGVEGQSAEGETSQQALDPQEGSVSEGGEPINAEGTATAQNLGETISTEVSVSVASGESTWLEVMADGESRVADQILGPWSETYVVSESLTIQANNTGVVSVFENGQARSFETRASGVGSITIKVPVATPQPEAEATAEAETGIGY